VACDIADAAAIEQLGLAVDDIVSHQDILREIERRGERHLLLKLMLTDPGGSFWDWEQSEKGSGGFEGRTAFFLKKSEDAQYKKAVKDYCQQNSTRPEDLTFDDGFQIFLNEYLPREFTVDDACLTNFGRVWVEKHFAL
jgi:hypothetical protein